LLIPFFKAFGELRQPLSTTCYQRTQKEQNQKFGATVTPAPLRGLSGSVVVIEMPASKHQNQCMEYDKDKVDEMVLALLFLTLHDGARAWKGHDWDAMNRLHEKGLILDPVGKAKSVVLTENGLKLCEELFRKHFCSAR